ncbi:MAG: DUF5674 family protein [Balneolaceae bacterium]
MKLVDTITVDELEIMAEKMYGFLVKAVVDIKKELLIVDAELHVDQERHLLEQGSRQEDLWGINLYPANFGTDDFVEFDSMINIRPRQKNMSRDVKDEDIRKRILTLVEKKVKP